MSVTSIDKDLDQLTMTVTGEYDVTAERAWQLWADPRQLERWWGPPTYPATVEEHDLRRRRAGQLLHDRAGGRHPARLLGRAEQVEAPRLLVVKDGFADEDGTPLDGMGVTAMQVDIVDRPGGGVVMTLTSTFSSLESLEQMVEMGMEEGLRQAMGQIDGLLAA